MDLASGSWAGSFGFSYDALSRRTSLNRPNNVTTNYSHDNLSRLLSVLHQVGGSTIDGASYTVDAAGNRTAKTDQRAGVTSNYGYDQIYELLTATQGGTTTESYTYDAVGNRLSSLGLSPYQYNVSNELTQTPNTIYAQDANGNTTIKTDSTGSTTYNWDCENRLTSVTLPGTGGTVTFKYDPFGRRIQKSFTQPGNPPTTTVTNYAYDGADSVEEVDQNGNILGRYARTSNVDEPLAESRSGTTSYYEADGLGSITSLTNSTGSVVQTYTFDSFGKLTASSGSITNPFRYTAREFDTETNLYFYRARYYDPAIGKFISEDPIGFGSGTNFYTYVGNSPANFSDPSGEVIKVLAGSDSADFQLALIYLEGSAAARAIIDPLEQSSHVYIVDAGDLAAWDATTPYKDTNVSWNPHKGLCVKNGVQSAAMQLLHEFVHLLQYQNNQAFNNPAAEQAAVQATDPAAVQLGEPTRGDYYKDAGDEPWMILPIPSETKEQCGCKQTK